MMNSLVKNNPSLSSRVLNNWFDALNLPVAPACNMMCNFCAKGSDCICIGNNPGAASKLMTPKQAVNWAEASVKKDKRVRILKITGPGEPLYNNQTFDTLKKLGQELPEPILGVSTNGLLLKERVKDLARLNVGMVEIAIHALYEESIAALYGRITKDGRNITQPAEIAAHLLSGQFSGIEACLEHNILVKVNVIYFPGINDRDILAIGAKCREMGVGSMGLASCCTSGKLKWVRMPSMLELICIQQELCKTIPDIEIRSLSGY